MDKDAEVVRDCLFAHAAVGPGEKKADLLVSGQIRLELMGALARLHEMLDALIRQGPSVRAEGVDWVGRRVLLRQYIGLGKDGRGIAADHRGMQRIQDAGRKRVRRAGESSQDAHSLRQGCLVRLHPPCDLFEFFPRRRLGEQVQRN